MNRRWAFLIAAAVVCSVAAVFLYRSGPQEFGGFFGCWFRRITGLYCPGCGMTRATHSAMHGHFAQAFRYNPVGFVLFPIAMLGLSLEAVSWANYKPMRWRLPVGKRGALVLAVVMIAFWILRNLPWWPFTLLAPPP